MIPEGMQECEECDGAGEICEKCGEHPENCDCGDGDWVDCINCGGDGFVEKDED